MVNFPPYLASVRWYSQWLHNIISGLPDEKAIKCVNFILRDGREFARTTLSSKDGRPFMLSMSIQGGSRGLRDMANVESAIISNHGDWRRVHRGSLEALYGRFPFYDHIEDALADIYENDSLITLKDFNSSLHRLVSGCLLDNLSNNDFHQLRINKIIRERGYEMAAGMNPEISVMDLMMLHGQEALYALLALKI